MEFVVTLAEAEQLELETIDATVTDEGEIEFTITGAISDVGSDTLDPIRGADVRPVAVAFETVT